jgi:hypothetical protein
VFGVPGVFGPGADQVTGRQSCAAFGFERGTEKDGRGRRVDAPAARAGVMTAGPQRVVRGRRGETLVNEPHGKRGDTSRECRSELLRGGRGGAFTAG